MNKHRLSGSIPVLLLFLVPWVLSCKGTREKDPVHLDIPRLTAFNPDGTPNEWKMEPMRLYANALGEYPDPGDLTASLRTAWNERGILICAEVEDDSLWTDTAAPWNGDALEVFLSPFRGSDDIVQFSFIPPAPGKKPGVSINDYRKSPALTDIQPETEFGIQRGNGRTCYEVRIDPRCLGVKVSQGNSLAMQVYVQDSDGPGGANRKQLLWYNLGHSYENSFAMYEVGFTPSDNPGLTGSSDVFITDGKEITLNVFGAVKGDRIHVIRNGKPWFKARAESSATWKSDTYVFGEDEADPENDSLIVNINGKFAGFHDLYISPRLYVNTEAAPFDREIRNFVMKDRLSPPPRHATLFVGSSSIRKWNSLRKDFPELKIIQRGFGGSTSTEALMYMDKIVLPYHPATVVYYEGDNDVPKGLSAGTIRENVKTFIERVLKQDSTTRIFILSPKPSVSRMKYWPGYEVVQSELRDLANKYPGVDYVDVSTFMFDENGNLKEYIFVNDGIHMNDKGYRIWTAVIRKALGLDLAGPLTGTDPE